MKYFSIFSLLLLGVLSLDSCSKDEEQIGSESEVLLLKKISSSNFRTFTEFEYDEQNRIQRFISYKSDSSINFTVDYEYDLDTVLRVRTSASAMFDITYKYYDVDGSTSIMENMTNEDNISSVYFFSNDACANDSIYRYEGTSLLYKTLIIYTDANCSEIQSKFVNDELSSKVVYVRDGKNAYDQSYTLDFYRQENKGNIVETQYYNSDNELIESLNSEFEYNEFDYPVTEIRTSSFASIDTIFYSYY